MMRIARPQERETAADEPSVTRRLPGAGVNDGDQPDLVQSSGQIVKLDTLPFTLQPRALQ